MDDMTSVMIWCASVIVGMILTLLLPRIFPDSRSSEVNQEGTKPIVADERLDELAGSMILGEVA